MGRVPLGRKRIALEEPFLHESLYIVHESCEVLKLPIFSQADYSGHALFLNTYGSICHIFQTQHQQSAPTLVPHHLAAAPFFC